MRRVNPFPERARFLWAFILNRWALNRRRTRVLPADYVPIVSVVIPALNEGESTLRIASHSDVDRRSDLLWTFTRRYS
jgi:hypothetical protein